MPVVQANFGTRDGGTAWQSANTSSSSLYVDDSVIDPALPSRLYTIAGHQPFRSSDSGSTWTAAGSSSAWFKLLTICPLTPTIIYAGRTSGAFRSVDSGNIWEVCQPEVLGARLLQMSISQAAFETEDHQT